MTDPQRPNDTGDFVTDARLELSGMLRDGLDHPSTRPVLVWGALGAVAGAALPFVSVGLGLAAGAGYKFYKRVRPD
ncbi:MULTISPECIES: hypothetical protein [Novosphingobium]|uniref:Uncharacterized protein n=2 Tax=Novosphingobium TaxID=165696 RepID=A0ABT0A9B2_9SPHN|nr:MULTISPECIES: hypothetical protein [Novosphingobium]MCJ1959780.1 hypothetical protein [Novosphingobium mangrovi (ex Hu et al. 2023)]QVM82486.1 hypothetical protein HT578_01125 [Novosphingobium decolorationis]TYC90749.1 hypothetical protein FMM79_05640 [Novosphingobium sp. BW1]GAM06937.1 hypothetical conserved protein [Novosphingobium sp. MBES04]